MIQKWQELDDHEEWVCKIGGKIMGIGNSKKEAEEFEKDYYSDDLHDKFNLDNFKKNIELATATKLFGAFERNSYEIKYGGVEGRFIMKLNWQHLKKKFGVNRDG